MDATDSAGRSVLPRVRKTRAVLALLALSAPRPVLRDQLAGLLWSNRDRDQARASLRQSVHELHDMFQSIGNDILIADRNHLSLQAGDIWLDTHELKLASASHPEPLSALSSPLLEDLYGLDPAFDRWLANERRRLQKLAVGIGETILAAETEAAAIIGASARLLQIDATHEGAWRATMEAYLRLGERAAALEAYERCAAALREHTGLEPSAATQAVLARVRGVGVPASELAPPLPRIGAAPGESAIRRLDARGVRLGVMPFRASEGSNGAALAMGLAEEITTALARFRWIFLIASPSLAVLAETQLDTASTWKTLDIDFLLDGLIREADGQMRVNVRLLDMRAEGELIWSHRFDRPMGDLFTLQDEIAAETVARVDPALLMREGRRASANPATNATAYDLVLRAIPSLYRLEEQGFREAGAMLARAVALDPDYAAAHAWWAYWHIFQMGQRWTTDPNAELARAGDIAQRAMQLDPSDARALTVAGHVRAYLLRRPSEGLALHERALSLNPNLPLAWLFSGLACCYLGNHHEAIRRVGQARRLSPLDPSSFFFDMAEMMAHLLLGEHQLVVELGRRALLLNPSFSSTHRIYVGALARLGLHDEMVAVREQLLALEPGFTVRYAVERSPIVREHERADYAEGLRLAGLPMG